ncbi:MAG: ABC transporter permease [Bryobacteraceae bacterium]
MNGVAKDISAGVRSLRKDPGLAILAVLTLALGIGASTAIFSVIYNVLLDPFPYPDAARVVAIQVHDKERAQPGGRTYYPLPEFLELRDQSRVFDQIIGGTASDVLMKIGEGTELMIGGMVTGNMFQFLGVPAQLGRPLTPDDAKPGAPPVFVLAYKAWLKHFQLDPGIVGKTYVLDGAPTTLVGIMPRRFTKQGADLWRPVELTLADPRLRNDWFNFQAKVKPGVTHAQIVADVEPILRRLAKQFPDNYPKNFSVEVVTWLDSLVGQFRKTLYTLAAAVGLLLLIACSNVANMLLAKASAREREMAIRSSIGASRGRLVRQLLVESIVLAVAGAALGCACAYGGVAWLAALIPEGTIPREVEIKLNPAVLLFSLVLSVFTALLFGLAPALQTVGNNLVEPLKDSGKGAGSGFRRGKTRSALVVVEVALSIVLLTGAGLLMRSFIKLQTVDLGFQPEGVVAARLPLPRAQYATVESQQRFFERVLLRAKALPGVVAATETSSLPPYGGIGSELEFAGQPQANEKKRGIFQLSSEGYFSTLGIKLIGGRLLTETEVAGARKVAVVNQTLAQKYFPNTSPIGRFVRVKFLETFPDAKLPNALFEIVGVVADAKNQGLQDPVEPELFIPYTVTGVFGRGILVKTAGNPAALLTSLRREIWAVDRGVALTLTGTLTDFMRDFSYAQPRFTLILLGAFAVSGLVLVAIGVYSMIAYTVSRQTHEIGIRVAIGAASSDVMRMVLWAGGRLILLGAAAGTLLALAVSRVLASELWSVSPYDPLTMGAVIVLIALVGLLACYVPAVRATRVDPLVALRYE